MIRRAPPPLLAPATPTLIVPERKPFVYRAAKHTQAFKPSPQQQDYFDWIVKGSGNLVLEAVAGAGKTTTLIEGLRLMEGSVFFGAYNKKISDEIRTKASERAVARNGIYINTLHGSGYSDWRAANKQVVVDDRKVSNIVKALFKPRGSNGAPDLEVFVCRMVSFGKQLLAGVKFDLENYVIWEKIMQHFSVDQELTETTDIRGALQDVVTVFRASHDACRTMIDFDDMIYAPIAHDLRLFKNMWVLVDECQDTNPARRELARRLLHPRGRMVAVGDSRQAIYGFTGASGDAIDQIIAEFGAKRLPLTVTYRCPKAVVNYVHQWVSHIEAHPDAPEGVVRPVVAVADRLCPTCGGSGQIFAATPPALLCDECKGARRLPAQPWFVQDAPTPQDAILCRYTRPLILTAFAMIREGIACKVEGRDIGKGLLSLASRWKIRKLETLVTRLDAYLAREVAKAREAESERREQEVTDKVGTLLTIIQRCRAQGATDLDSLYKMIEELFADDVSEKHKNCITLSTGHKAKGREWPRVYWLQTTNRRKGQQEWELVQEDNISYVIGTRAQAELILVPEGVHTGK